MNDEVLGASFRDPSGFVFTRDGVVHRRVNRSYAPHYDRLMSSGLYEELTGKGLLVSHEEVEDSRAGEGQVYRTLRPQQIPFLRASRWGQRLAQIGDACRHLQQHPC